MCRREGEPGRPHDHRRLAVIPLSTRGSDGSEVASADLDPRFPGGLVVAMSDDRTFQLDAWDELARRITHQAR